MNIQDIISHIAPRQVINQGIEADITHLTYDSRTVCEGSCFFAIRGSVSDGHNYISMATDRGAGVIICESMEGVAPCSGVVYLEVESSERAMALVSQLLYGDPSREIELIGVTGTNGKSTVATLLSDLFERLGYKTGLISTLTYRIAGEEQPSTHTTPDTIRLNRMLREMVDKGCSYCFMEVSSHSVVQERIAGLTFRGAIFTNLTHDHLDYHGSFMEYLRAKKSLFDRLGSEAFAIVNIDDRNGEVMTQNCRGEVVRLSTRSLADHRARVVEMHFDGMQLLVDGVELWTQLIGEFNAQNILAIYATALQLGVSRDEALMGISTLRSVRGRFEYISAPEGRTIIVDYAHTPDALRSTLMTIRGVDPTSEIITVCGCGGDRDREKRPEMARVAYESSTTAIFTSDNPRSESPEAILQDMVNGVKERVAGHQWLKITDRGEAIRTAIMLSTPHSVILIAGKGHETYQIIGGERLHFDDMEEAAKAINEYLKN